jgi:hypothetical protein
VAKKNAPTTDPKSEATNDSDRVQKYVKEFTEWRTDLKQYWPQMEKNQEMYEFFKREYADSDTEVSLNTPFSIVESQVAKENEATVEVTVRAKGEDNLEEFERWISSTVKGAIEDPDIAVLHGSFRKIKESFSRQLKVIGNSVAEVNYCYKTDTVDGERKVIADNPYTTVRHWKSVIFNPTKQFDNSDVYYIEDWVKLSDLTSNEYSEEKGSDGEVKKKGKYKNLGDLKKSLQKDGKISDDDSVQFITGNKKVARKNEPIHILTRWEGTKRCVIANDRVVIQEDIDPHKIGRHNLLLATRYKVVGRPYAYGEIDAIYKPVRAQDTIVSQSIEIVNRYLRGSYILGPSVDADAFMMVLKYGGAMSGDPTQIAPVPVQPPPAQAFQQIDVMQQAIERAARYSPYSAGLAGQSSDKTAGTASGIQSIQAAAEPNVQTQIDDIQDMFMQPLGRIYLMMIANLMGEDEVRYTLLKGENKKWVTATKNILKGKATIQDMVTAGLINEQEAVDYVTTEVQVVDPNTGQPMMQRVPIPGADEALVFDVDWLVEVRLDNQSASTKEQETQKQVALIQLGQQMGVQFNPKKTISYLGHRQDFDRIDDLMLSKEEMQQQMMQKQQQEQAQMAQQQQSQQADQQAKMQQEAMKQQGNMAIQQARAQSQMQLKTVRQNQPVV